MLELRRVTKTFGGLIAVNNVSFQLDTGELLGLIGPNGAGKSVLLNTITGIYKPVAGEVLFKGKKIAGLRPDKIASKGITRIFQLQSIFPGFSVFDNILVGFQPHIGVGLFAQLFNLSSYRKQEKDVTEKAMEHIRSLGLATVKDEPVQSLPIGIQRRVAIATALVADPELLLLDEPLAGLSPAEANEVMDLLATLNSQGLTMLLIEHHVKAVMAYCKRIIVLNYGSKIAEGTPAEIQKNEQVIEAYLGA